MCHVLLIMSHNTQLCFNVSAVGELFSNLNWLIFHMFKQWHSTYLMQYLSQLYRPGIWETIWKRGLCDTCSLQHIMCTIIFKIVSVKHHLLLCQAPQPQDPDCNCYPRLPFLSLFVFSLSFATSLSLSSVTPLRMLWHWAFPAGDRDRQETATAEKNRENTEITHWDKLKRRQNMEEKNVCDL